MADPTPSCRRLRPAADVLDKATDLYFEHTVSLR